MVKDFREDTWEDLGKNLEGKGLFLFGAGNVGIKVCEDLYKYCTSWDVLGILDNDPDKEGRHICGVQVFLPEVLRKYDLNNIVVLICNWKTNAIARQLHELGVRHYYSAIHLDVPKEFRETCHQSIIDSTDIEWLKQRVADDYSRFLVDAIVEKRRTGFFDYTDIRSEGNEYFIDEFFTRNGYEVFIDGGGYDGDTIDEFVQWTQGHYNKIYTFEPQSDKSEMIEKKLWKYNGKVELIKKGLYDCQKELSFWSGNHLLSGKIDNKSGNTLIQTIDIDSVIHDMVTFIKMDIEGAEFKALLGAKNTIKKYKPNLAICIYHKPEDIWTIPRFIDSLVPEYKFHIRHFGWRYTSTILYCHL